MRFIDFISVKLTFFLIIGILFGFYVGISLSLGLILLVSSLIGLVLSYKRQRRNSFPFFGLIALTTSFTLGIVIVNLSKEENFDKHYSYKLSNEQQIWQLKVTEVLKPTLYSDRYFVQVLSFNNKSVKGKLLLTLPNDSISTELSIDDELSVLAKADEIVKPLNPNQFDYRAYLKKKGILHQIKAEPAQVLSKRKGSKTLQGIASNFRTHIISELEEGGFGTEEFGVIQALLLGQRNNISDETYGDYKNAGAVHILAVSGLHIGILLLILQFLLRPLELLPKGKTIKLLTLVLLLWSFAFIAGLSPSVVRAVTMFSFIAYALYLNRPSNMFNIIALSMFFILLVYPMFLFEVGFQMSYAAVFAIVWIYPKLQSFWYPENRLLRYFWQLLSMSIAAQIGVLPISLFYFHQFPSLFFISNLIVIPFLGIILGIGILVIVLSLLNALPSFLVTAYNFLIKTTNSVVGWVAQQEDFVFKGISFDGVQLLLTYVLFFGLIFSFSRPKFKNIALVLTSLIGLSTWNLYNDLKIKRKEQLVLAHQIKNTLLLHQNGKELRVHAFDAFLGDRIVTDFQIAERVETVTTDTIQNSYTWNGKSILVIDSMAVFPVHLKPDYVLLTQSPKINLERLIDSIQPKYILADGSNYNSYVKRWKATCHKKKLLFHHTGEKGAFYFELGD